MNTILCRKNVGNPNCSAISVGLFGPLLIPYTPTYTEKKNALLKVSSYEATRQTLVEINFNLVDQEVPTIFYSMVCL